MRKNALLCLAALTLFAACGKKVDAPQASTTPKSTASTEVTGFGVPECDTYIKKYLECVDSRVPESARQQMRAALEASRSAWQQTAATEVGRATLAAGCTQATEMARASMLAYGCEF